MLRSGMMMFSKALSSSIAILSVIGGPCAAQTAAMSEIIVTETRTPQDKRLLVGNAARLEADAIAFIRPEHVSEALNRLPGAYVHRGSGQEHLTAIRSPVLTSGAGAGSFLYLEDGVPMRAAGFSNVNGLFEAHAEIAGAVELVRGPGGALYGANAVHGLVNIIPQSPAPGGFADASYGSYGRAQGNIAFGTEALFAGATFLHEDGYRDASGLDQQKITLRAAADIGAWRTLTTLSGHNLNQETAGFVRGADAYRNASLRRTNPNPEAFRDTKALRLAVKADRDLAEGVRLAVTPYARWNDMEFLLHFLPSQALEENGHWSAGSQNAVYFESGDSLAIIGFDWEYTEGFLKETQSLSSFGTFPEGVHYDYDVTSLAASPYIHWEGRVAPRLKLSAGVRGDFTRYDYDNNTDADDVGRFRRPADRTDDFASVLGKAGALYEISDVTALYASYARGARPPQTTDLYRLQTNQSVGDIDSETIDSYEAGLRYEGARFSIDAAAFYMEKDNFFFRDADGFNVTDGKTRHEGLEIEADVRLGPTLSLAAAGTLARHTYRFSNDVNRNATESIARGDDVDTAPRRLLNVRALWRPADIARMELEWVHIGEYFTDAANDNRYPGHDLLNARLIVTPRNDIAMFVTLRNIADADYAERADFAFGSERYFPGEGRAVSFGVRKRF
ncbi:MAG: TonB-dependent receptor [Pseudomonadota bacterium]